jgi:ketosteroid isomerase-like protein
MFPSIIFATKVNDMTAYRPMIVAVQTMVLAFACTASAQAASYGTAKAQILQIEQNMADIPTAAEALKYFDSNIVLDDLTPGRMEGKTAVGALITAQFAAIKNIQVKILSMSVNDDANLAFAYSLQKITFTYPQSTQPMSTIYRQVDCYHRVGGSWLILYQQLSVPIDPTTGKAVFNAGP